MTLRKITSTQELDQIAKQWQTYRDWEAYRTFAFDYFGPEAAAIHVEEQGEYNDESWGYSDAGGIVVHDAAGQVLPPDLSLAIWDTQFRSPWEVRALAELRALPRAELLSSDTEEEVENNLEDGSVYIEGIAEALAELRTGLPRDGTMGWLNLTTPPKLSFTALYLEE